MRLYVAFVLLALVTALLIPISASAQTPVDCVAIIDSDGTRVARAFQKTPIESVFYLGHNGFAVPLELHHADAIWSTQSGLYFPDANCSTTPFVGVPEANRFPAPVSVLIGQVVYYTEPSSVSQDVLFLSTRNSSNGSCQPTSFATGAVPALHQFAMPQYTPPFHLEPEACYTPDPSVAALTPYSLGAMALVLAFGAYLTMRRSRVA